ncbi:hypothetical protein A8C32_06290 [Flavivirga aquatica]|uniref:Stress-response A/B barrel domain-containing protein n=1 Tax=Flavivirga aquatica TaxID=1849968 RepID=A0A1E5SI34_9FLAO|nr:Dabb family protein [Flavivirga aquatica]OEJ98797.1 hypothetical protein A8C32_06290 [Flavivirga aquatica]
MVIHIVIFKLIKTDTTSIDSLKEQLFRLKDLPYLADFDIIEKSNLLKSYIDGDLVLFSKFKNKKDLELYMTDETHLEVIKNTSINIQEKYILDFASNNIKV